MAKKSSTLYKGSEIAVLHILISGSELIIQTTSSTENIVLLWSKFKVQIILTLNEGKFYF